MKKQLYNFPMMSTIIPTGKLGCAEIIHRIVNQKEVDLNKLRDHLNSQRTPTNNGLWADTYTVLLVNKTIAMSDTWIERSTCANICEWAHGRVLIFGLGIGLILTRILPKKTVLSVTVVEKYPEVGELVLPYLQNHFTEAVWKKLTVIYEDAFKFRTQQLFNTIWVDIDSNLSEDTQKNGSKLLTRFKHNLYPFGESVASYWLKGVRLH